MPFRIRDVDWTPEKVGRFWSYFSTKSQGERIYFSSLFGDQIIKKVKRYVPLSEGRVLDFGCGQGFMIERLLAQGIRSEGLEFSAASAESIYTRNKTNPCFGGVTVADRLPSHIGSATMDVVFLVEVVEHLLPEQVSATMMDILRVLKPGGFLVLTTPHNEDLERVKTMCPDCGCVFHPWQHVRSYSTDALEKLLQNNGLKTILCQPTNWERHWAIRSLKWMFERLTGRAHHVVEPHLIYIGLKPM